jgi:hypothetical protein
MARGRRSDSAGISWEDAIETVLRDRGEPMHYTEIAEEISNRRLKKVANPAASVSVTFTKCLASGSSPFIRTGRGEYGLSSQTPSEIPQIVDETGAVDAETGALRAFGMYWRRDQVLWSGRPRLWGRQSEGASDVDFSEQVGVYLLHDRDRTIYVGRATDTLFARLKAHNGDRLSGRWDRFSWFGLRGVQEDGTLGDPATAWTHNVVIETLEALLIETVEPPLNRKRGDNLAAVEFLQVVDPAIEDRKLKEMFEDWMTSRGRG